MLDLQNYTYLIIFPDGTIFEGVKFPIVCNHHQILKAMCDKYPVFKLMTSSYDFENHKDHIKFYNYCIKEGAIIYHAWATYFDEVTEDANIYLPDKITLEQKGYMDVIIDQLYQIGNVVPHEIRNRGILESSEYIPFEGAKYVDSYIDDHLIKNK